MNEHPKTIKILNLPSSAIIAQLSIIINKNITKLVCFFFKNLLMNTECRNTRRINIILPCPLLFIDKFKFAIGMIKSKLPYCKSLLIRIITTIKTIKDIVAANIGIALLVSFLRTTIK